MAEDHTPATQPSGEEAQNGSSSGLKKLLLGCGCGVLILVFVCTGATVALWYTSSSILPDDGQQLVRRLVNLARQQPTRGSDAGGSLTRDMLAHGDVPEALGEPLTLEDAREFLSTLDAFTNTDAFQKQKGAADEIRNVAKSGGDAGTVERLKGVWSLTEYATQTNELDRAYREVVGGPDGGRTFFSRMVRVAALMAAADHTAKKMAEKGAEEPDPLSDAVASSMLEQRASLAKEYTTEFQRALDVLDEFATGDTGTERPENLAKFSQKMKKVQPAMALASQPGMIAFGRLDATTFETWSKLGADARRKLVDRMYDVAGLFPFAKPKAGLKVFQYMLTTPERARLQPQLTR